MKTPLSHRLLSVAFAACLTWSVLAAIDSLAAVPAPAATWASATAIA